jgi:negative regulator of flagellin synthesis FlgM
VKVNGGGSIKPTSPTGVEGVTSGKPAGSQPATATQTSARGDKVEITSLSAQLAQLEKVLADVGVVDASRVAELKLAISEGRFHVDSELVADKLLASVREYLLTQQKG